MAKEWLSVNELAEKTGIPDTSIRRYLAKFPDFIDYKGGVRARRYEETAIKVLLRIKSLYDAGYETEQVDSKLKSEFAITIKADEVEKKEAAGVKEEKIGRAVATVEDIAEIKQALKEQQEFNKLLLEQLSKQDQYIRESLEKRDRQLMESLNTMQEERKALIESAANREKLSFWARLFKS